MVQITPKTITAIGPGLKGDKPNKTRKKTIERKIKLVEQSWI